MLRKLFVTLLATLALAAIAPNAYAAGIDVNRASQAELETVKGIGPGLSGKILKARESGTFKDWSDMVGRVGGVGPGNAARFSQAGLTVGGAAFDAGKPAGDGAAKATRAVARPAKAAADAPAAKRMPKAERTAAPKS